MTSYCDSVFNDSFSRLAGAISGCPLLMFRKRRSQRWSNNHVDLYVSVGNLRLLSSSMSRDSPFTDSERLIRTSFIHSDFNSHSMRCEGCAASIGFDIRAPDPTWLVAGSEPPGCLHDSQLRSLRVRGFVLSPIYLSLILISKSSMRKHTVHCFALPTHKDSSS